MARFKNSGTWWYYPSFLETPPGPWAGPDPLDDDCVRGWKRAIEWMAKNEMNFVISGIPSYRKDQVYHDWGYHYVVEFEGFPEAKVFTDEFVKKNRDKLRAIFAFAQEKGVAPYIHHYNFCAPVGFVKAHKEMADKIANYTDGRQSLQDRLGYVYGNVCWNEPIYQEFLMSAIREFFQKIPECEGVLITPGECAFCPCPKCRGEKPGERGRANIATMSHFVRTFVDTVKGAGKTPLVRTHVMDPDGNAIKEFPQDVTYVIKYSVFDCIDAPPDPAIQKWVNSGGSVWVSNEISGGENAGPIAWFDPKYFWDAAENLEKIGVEGIMSIDNTDYGFMGLPYRVQQANLLAHTYYVNHGGPYDEEVWRKHFREIFGEKGDEILKAAVLYARVPLNISKMVYSGVEGFTWQFPYHLALDTSWPGALGTEGLDPPDWVIGDLARVNDYVRYLEKNEWREDLLEHVAGDRKPPLAHFAEQTEAARKGEKILAGISEDEVKNDARQELRILQTSARLAVLVGEQWQHLLMGRIYFAGATGVSPEEVRRDLAKRCMAEYRKGIEAFRLQIESVLDLPHGIFDFEQYTGSARQWQLSIPNRTRMMERELAEIEEKLAPLLK